MNFLAHLYLSGDDENVMIGNFIGDHVKGNNFLKASPLTPLQRRGEQEEKYNEGIIKGIKLHRLIDAFTDSHPLVEEGKKRLRPYFHKYSPVITDVFYDHFLAKNWRSHHHQPLELFVANVYSMLKKNENILPLKTNHMLTYMIPNNWLVAYSSLEGINKALTGMARRTSFESGMDKATIHLQKDYLLYEKEFEIFFDDLKKYCSTQKSYLQKQILNL